ncbi:MAG: hypothetical protein M0017_00360 [Desulfobacteraceae bacterium]|nr:hypothetical protein [Desulfobacteraceae bacterium]
MTIYEIKDPQSSPRPEPPSRQAAPPVDGVRPVVRIRRGGGSGGEGRGRKGNPPEPFPPAQEHELRQLIEQVNRDLEHHAIPLRLVLLAAPDGLLLEIFDCTGGQLCRAVRDLEIDAAELPAFLAKLQREAGLLVDTLS